MFAEAKNTAPAAPFIRGTGEWSGVVMIERPANATRETLCRVTSARTLALDGKRAIVCRLPYSMLSHYFTVVDLDHVCVYAEFKAGADEEPGHLELYERASKREFFLHATPATSAVH